MILITGFERFSKYSVNLSEQVVKGFQNKINGHQIHKIILPVSWKRSLNLYKSFLNKLATKPSAVIMLGIHSGNSIRIERYAWNIAIGLDEDLKFKVGFIRKVLKLRLGSILNLKSNFSAILHAYGADLSSYMGFYICNYMYFQALMVSKTKYPLIFIHIPLKASLKKLKHLIYDIILRIIRLEEER